MAVRRSLAVALLLLGLAPHPAALAQAGLMPDDADQASLLAAVASTRTYLDKLRKPTLTLLGKEIPVERFRATAARFEALVKTSWGTPGFEGAIADEFERIEAPGVDGGGAVRFTGYHLPLLDARTRRDERFRYPLYAPPTDMLSIQLGSFRPNLAGTTLIGRLVGKQVVPYYSRSDIDDKDVLGGRNLELAWVDDELARFQLMVQGSGLLRFDDGRVLNVNYAGQNGHPYVGLGKAMVADGVLSADQLSMPGIMAYFDKHPEQLHGYLDRNPSYVFFKLAQDGPYGVDGIPLTAGRSIATDKKLFPSGAIDYMQYPRATFDALGKVTHWGDGARFVMDQDTGGAIVGPGRVDIYWGGGPDAAQRAGTLNGMGRLSVLLLKQPDGVPGLPKIGV